LNIALLFPVFINFSPRKFIYTLGARQHIRADHRERPFTAVNVVDMNLTEQGKKLTGQPCGRDALLMD
jgi:hypothetical protein